MRTGRTTGQQCRSPPGRGAADASGLARRRVTIREAEGRGPRLAPIGRLLAELPHRAVGRLAVAQADQRPAPLPGDDHRLAVPAAGEEGAGAAGIDPELLPMLRRGDVDAQPAARLIAERHPVLPDPTAI